MCTRCLRSQNRGRSLGRVLGTKCGLSTAADRLATGAGGRGSLNRQRLAGGGSRYRYAELDTLTPPPSVDVMVEKDEQRMTGRMDAHTTHANAVSARENAASELTRESQAGGQGLAGPSSSDTSPSHDVEEGEYWLMFPTPSSKAVSSSIGLAVLKGQRDRHPACSQGWLSRLCPLSMCPYHVHLPQKPYPRTAAQGP